MPVFTASVAFWLVAQAAPVHSPAGDPAAKAPLPAADAKPSGLDTFPTVGIQLGAGVATCCVGGCVTAPLGCIPFVGNCLQLTALGALIGGVEGVAGDMFGTKRDALMFPLIAGAAPLLAGALVNIGISVAQSVTRSALPPFDPTNPGTYINAVTSSPFALAQAGVSLVAGIGAIVAPAVVYQLTAVDKKPGDTGQAFPGFSTPADPSAAQPPPATPPATPQPSTTQVPPPNLGAAPASTTY